MCSDFFFYFTIEHFSAFARLRLPVIASLRLQDFPSYPPHPRDSSEDMRCLIVAASRVFISDHRRYSLDRTHVNGLWLYFPGFSFETGSLQGSQ